METASASVLSFEEKRTLLEGDVLSCAYSPNGQVLACSMRGGMLSLQMVVSGSYYAPVKMVNVKASSVVSFLDPQMVVHSMDRESGASAGVLDLEKGKYTRLFTGHSADVYNISSNTVLKSVITCAENDYVLVWDMRQKAPYARIPSKKRPVAKYSPDGKIFSLFFDEKKEMKLFDARSFSTGPYATKILEAFGYRDADFSPDGRKMVLLHDRSFTLVDGLDGATLGTIASEHAASAAFSTDNAYLLYTSSPNQIAACSVQSLKCINTWTLSSDVPVRQIYINPTYAQAGVLAGALSLWQ
ncbi:COMPASS component SWD2 [Nematocida displodere]|uniref:COMPASS component SWD2 n=1 Tax=Nematocida displodere TaxID=1805483 RepID=A0A177EI77_9MICR|nr:COMPASS component SWD2 [Nematocida displodere]